MSTIDINNNDPLLLNEDDRITAYLKGQMTVDEENAFMKDLQENPLLKEKAIAMARLVKSMKEMGTLQDDDTKKVFLSANEKKVKQIAFDAVAKEKKKDWLNAAFSKGHEAAFSDTELYDNSEASVTESRDANPHNKKKRNSFTRIVSWLSIAASLFLVVWVGIGYNDYRKTTRLAEEYENVFESPIISRGAQTSETEQRLQSLFDNVSTKTDLDNTLHELSLLWELSTMETYNDYTEYASEIGWYLAIGYLKDSDKKNATKILKALAELTSENDVIGVKARELLESLS